VLLPVALQVLPLAGLSSSSFPRSSVQSKYLLP
jgi:hypothetical protein